MKKKNIKKLTIKKVTVQNLSGEYQKSIKGGYGYVITYGTIQSVCRICPTREISICMCPTLYFSCGGSVQVCCA
jgi:hypothetical protein